VALRNFEVRDIQICTPPKAMSAAPPTAPIKSLTAPSLTNVKRPRASAMTRVNSTIVCAKEKISPPLAPIFEPCERLAKNKGPGARAPEAVIKTTVSANSSSSMELKKYKSE